MAGSELIIFDQERIVLDIVLGIITLIGLSLFALVILTILIWPEIIIPI